MKNLITLFTAICLFTSCIDREVQLPHTTNNDITEVVDVSPIYMFYDETKPDSVDFNRRNMISTTNWLVNIDKRLTLKKILPHLQYLQEKRHGNGMHKNENAKNYFTCFNPETENLSFIEFTDVDYNTTLNENNFKDFSKISYYCRAKFNSLENVEMHILSNNHDVVEKYNTLQLISDIARLIKLGKVNLEISFKSAVSFQDYILIKTMLHETKSDSLQVSMKEFIYN